VKNSLPGNSKNNQEKLNKVSKEAMHDEKNQHNGKLKVARAEFIKVNKELSKVFDVEGIAIVLKRVELHMERVKIQERKGGEDLKESTSNLSQRKAAKESLNLHILK
jgi:predicted ABC-type ATPase